jgi:hypothetical protein
VILEIKKKAVHKGPQSTFPPFYRKGLIGVQYYNISSPLKATFLGLPRILGPGLSKNKDEGFFSFLCFSRQASGDCLSTEARRLEGAGPI